jgi:pantoate--beta-alanine ligase
VQPDPALADILEGHYRPGFFAGVCTVVLKLLACTQARSALFGKKDYQQLLIIRHMVRQFYLPVDVIGQDTHREADGLAMSSRNSYLSPDERAHAALLEHTLLQCADAVRQGNTAFTDLENQALQTLRAHPGAAVGLSDALIAHIDQAQGCSHTVSFDKGAVRWAGMQLLV